MEPEISVVVPLRDESANVLPLAEQIRKALQQVSSSVEIILVDDGSTDDTWEKIQEASRGNVSVRGVRHAKNAGQSAALWTGFKASHGSIIATLDGDLQNDPADFPNMLKLLENAEMVCGVRTKRADNRVRLISSYIARKARKWMLGMDFADTGCNLRIFKRSVIENLPAFDGLHRFMPVFVHNVGGRVRQVPVVHHARTAGRSKYGIGNRLFRGLRDLLMVRWFLQRQIGKVVVTNPGLSEHSARKVELGSAVEHGSKT